MRLLPCPFCGSPAPENLERGNPNWTIDESRLSPRMDGPGALISVEVRHWCGGATKTQVRTVGRDHEEAERNWNRRLA